MIRSRKQYLWILGFSSILLATGIYFFTRRSQPPSTVNLYYQSSRWGSVTQCACEIKPYGGIDRLLNAMRRARKEDPGAIFIEGSQSLFSQNPIASEEVIKKEQVQVKEIVDALNLVGVDLFAPGPIDLKYGVSFLKTLKEGAKFPFLSSNIVDKATKVPLFENEIVLERSGNRILFFSYIDPSKMAELPESDALEVMSLDALLEKNLERWKTVSDLIVMVNHMPILKAEKLAQTREDIHIFLASDDRFASEKPYLYPKNSILWDPGFGGYTISHLKLNLSLPIKGFANLEIIQKNKERYESENARQEKAGGEPSNTEQVKQQMRDAMVLSIQDGDSLFEFKNVALDKETFGAENELTTLVQSKLTPAK